MYTIDPKSLKEETRLFFSQNLDKLVQAVEIGVLVLSHVDTSREVDYVKNAFDKLHSDFDKRLLLMEANINKIVIDTVMTNFDPNTENSYSQKMVNFLRDHVKTFKEDTDKKLTEVKTAYDDFVKAVDFNNEISPLGKVKSIVIETQKFIDVQFDEAQPNSFANNLREKLKVYFSENGVIPRVLESSIRLEMDKHIKPIMEEFVKIRELLAKEEGKEEIMEITSEKGFIFEDELFKKLEETAKAFGDSVEQTGLTKETSTGSQKGDFMYYLNNTKSAIVIEAKDKNIVLKASIEYMKEALASRNSPFGILVTKNADQLQKQVGYFGFYNDNMIITHAGFLTEAIRFAKAFLQYRLSTQTDSIDIGKIQSQIQILNDQFKVDTTIKKKLTELDTSVTATHKWIKDEIDKSAIEKKNAINAILQEIEK